MTATVSLNQHVCAGFGNCSTTAPKYFGFDDDQLVGTVRQDTADDADLADLHVAQADCPTQAIAILLDAKS